jgi:hypothetical protein
MPADPTPQYQRLPGAGGAAFQRHRLWLGPDHLLQVASSVVGEQYKRFYFADIQAVVLRRSQLGLIASMAWLAGAALCAALFLTEEDAAARVFPATCAGLCLLLAVVVFFTGRQCVCTIRTAVQTEDVPSLRRLRTVRRVLARIRPAIEAAQSAPAPMTP